MDSSFLENTSDSHLLKPISSVPEGPEGISKGTGAINEDMILGCALEALQMGQESTQFQKDIKISPYIVDNDGASGINELSENILFGSDEELQALFNEIPDDIFVSVSDIALSDEEILGLDKQILELASIEEEDFFQTSPDYGIIFDDELKRFFVGAFDSDLIRHNPDKLMADLRNGKLVIKDSFQKQFLEASEAGKIEPVGVLSDDILELLASAELEMVVISDEQWEDHVKQTYLVSLGMKVEFSSKEPFESIRSQNRTSSSTIANRQLFKSAVSVLVRNPLGSVRQRQLAKTIEVRGRVLANLRKIERLLLEIREEKKESEKRALRDQILKAFIKNDQLQFDQLSSDLKKEKIQYLNAESFLMYLLKWDRKYFLMR